MVIHSSEQTVRDDLVSVLAVFECLVATAVFLFLYVEYQDKLIFAAGLGASLKVGSTPNSW